MQLGWGQCEHDSYYSPEKFLHGKLRTLINPVNASGPAIWSSVYAKCGGYARGIRVKGYALMLDSLLARGRKSSVRMNDGISASLEVMFSRVTVLWTVLRMVFGMKIRSMVLSWNGVDEALGIYLLGRFATQANSRSYYRCQCLDATSAQLTTVGEGLYAQLSTETRWLLPSITYY
jgi:hypothetical protein